MDSFQFQPNKNEPIDNKQPSICFACVCKNEEGCILTALESVCDFIDYWVICDTGSTDTTCELITTFFKAKDIPGELFHDTWENFGHNKTLLFNRCIGKADYILHFDADDYFVGKPVFTGGKTQYYINVVKKSTHYPCLLLFDARYTWKFCGVAHTTIKALDCENVTTGYLTDKPFYMYSTPDTGARSSDPEKYLKDAEKLRQQFFDTMLNDPDNLNNRSIFYTAQSYRDYGNLEESAKWYKLYTRLRDTWVEERYYSFVQLGVMYSRLKFSYGDVESCYKQAIDLIDDRAEAYFHLGMLYNQNKKFESSYSLLKKAKSINFDTTRQKYILFLDNRTYGKFLNDELSVACFWLGKYQEGYDLLKEIIDDPDFEWCKRRLLENDKHFKGKLNIV
jgi:hypothetical protein